MAVRRDVVFPLSTASAGAMPWPFSKPWVAPLPPFRGDHFRKAWSAAPLSKKSRQRLSRQALAVGVALFCRTDVAAVSGRTGRKLRA